MFYLARKWELLRRIAFSQKKCVAFLDLLKNPRKIVTERYFSKAQGLKKSPEKQNFGSWRSKEVSSSFLRTCRSQGAGNNSRKINKAFHSPKQLKKKTLKKKKKQETLEKLLFSSKREAKTNPFHSESKSAKVPQQFLSLLV